MEIDSDYSVGVLSNQNLSYFDDSTADVYYDYDSIQVTVNDAQAHEYIRAWTSKCKELTLKIPSFYYTTNQWQVLKIKSTATSTNQLARTFYYYLTKTLNINYQNNTFVVLKYKLSYKATYADVITLFFNESGNYYLKKAHVVDRAEFKNNYYYYPFEFFKNYYSSKNNTTLYFSDEYITDNSLINNTLKIDNFANTNEYIYMHSTYSYDTYEGITKININKSASTLIPCVNSSTLTAYVPSSSLLGNYFLPPFAPLLEQQDAYEITACTLLKEIGGDTTVADRFSGCFNWHTKDGFLLDYDHRTTLNLPSCFNFPRGSLIKCAGYLDKYEIQPSSNAINKIPTFVLKKIGNKLLTDFSPAIIMNFTFSLNSSEIPLYSAYDFSTLMEGEAGTKYLYLDSKFIYWIRHFYFYNLSYELVLDEFSDICQEGSAVTNRTTDEYNTSGSIANLSRTLDGLKGVFEILGGIVSLFVPTVGWLMGGGLLATGTSSLFNIQKINTQMNAWERSGQNSVTSLSALSSKNIGTTNINNSSSANETLVSDCHWITDNTTPIPCYNIQIWGANFIQLCEWQKDIFWNGYNINGYYKPNQIISWEPFCFKSFDDTNLSINIKSYEYSCKDKDIDDYIYKRLNDGVRYWTQYFSDCQIATQLIYKIN